MLINAAALEAIEKKTTVFDFRYRMASCRTFDRRRPEEGIAYEEPYALDLFAANGLEIQWPIHYGNWRRQRSRMGHTRLDPGLEKVRMNSTRSDWAVVVEIAVDVRCTERFEPEALVS